MVLVRFQVEGSVVSISVLEWLRRKHVTLCSVTDALSSMVSYVTIVIIGVSVPAIIFLLHILLGFALDKFFPETLGYLVMIIIIFVLEIGTVCFNCASLSSVVSKNIPDDVPKSSLNHLAVFIFRFQLSSPVRSLLKELTIDDQQKLLHNNQTSVY